MSYINKIFISNNFILWDYMENDIAINYVKRIGKHIKVNYVESWNNSVQNTSPCQSLYKHIKFCFKQDFHLIKLPEPLRVHVTKFRTLDYRFPIQNGRYESTAREERLCRLCDAQVVGDELYFVLECQNVRLTELISQYISPYYSQSPSIDKLSELFCNNG
ncbi:unnamed protein product [Meganyctiphanes norvegica]|uniref:Uncharacterized protein n=1 Tax=Meganyctiphanes norvegica TaxID=48144 RepID=A0AAV2SBM1_MEGNR